MRRSGEFFPILMLDTMRCRARDVTDVDVERGGAALVEGTGLLCESKVDYMGVEMNEVMMVYSEGLKYWDDQQILSQDSGLINGCCLYSSLVVLPAYVWFMNDRIS